MYEPYGSPVTGGSVVGGGAGGVVRGAGADVRLGGAGVVAWAVGRVVAGCCRAGGVVVGGRFGAGSRDERFAWVDACRLAFAAADADWAAVPAGWARLAATAALAATAPTDSAAVVVPIATVARRRRATDASAEGRTLHLPSVRRTRTDARPQPRRRRLSGT